MRSSGLPKASRFLHTQKTTPLWPAAELSVIRLKNCMLIRIEDKRDLSAIHLLNASVFETESEAILVDVLRDKAHPFISIVAEKNKEVVGHIMFTPVILSGHPDINIMGLAPLAVSQKHQRNGIGSSLIRAGVERCKQLEIGAVVVLGHSEYYPRFGFLPTSHFGIGCEYEVPEEAFMILELQSGYLSDKSGIIKYHVAFKNV